MDDEISSYKPKLTEADGINFDLDLNKHQSMDGQQQLSHSEAHCNHQSRYRNTRDHQQSKQEAYNVLQHEVAPKSVDLRKKKLHHENNEYFSEDCCIGKQQSQSSNINTLFHKENANSDLFRNNYYSQQLIDNLYQSNHNDVSYPSSLGLCTSCREPLKPKMVNCSSQTTNSTVENAIKSKVDVGIQATADVKETMVQTEENQEPSNSHVKTIPTEGNQYKSQNCLALKLRLKKIQSLENLDKDYMPHIRKEVMMQHEVKADAPSNSTRQRFNPEIHAGIYSQELSDSFDEELNIEFEDTAKEDSYSSSEWDSKHPNRKRSKKKKKNKKSSSIILSKPDQDSPEKIALRLKKPFKCPYCHKRFIKDSSLSNHKLNSCTKNRLGNDFICSECGDHFHKFSMYKRHLKLHTGEFFKCSCGDKFEGYLKLKAHTELEHTSGEYHVEVHPYACNICFKSFIFQGRYKRHMITHDNNAKIACSICGKEFEKSYMEVHERSHSGMKPFACEFTNCSMSYPSKKLLQRHERIHQEEFRLPCTYCEKIFSQKSRLKDHLRVHTGEKPYICESCGARFSRTNHLRRHKLIHAKNYSSASNKTLFTRPPPNKTYEFTNSSHDFNIVNRESPNNCDSERPDQMTSMASPPEKRYMSQFSAYSAMAAAQQVQYTEAVNYCVKSEGSGTLPNLPLNSTTYPLLQHCSYKDSTD